MCDSPFERCGLASLSDLQHPEAISLLQEMEALQDQFLNLKPHSPGYSWPKDALHTWSRVWEYPYVLHHVRAWRCAYSGPHIPTAVDFGSGVTFFPFAVAREGINVICVDKELTYGNDIERVARHLSAGTGSVSFRGTNGCQLPFDSASVDLVYSISVFEHLPEYPALLTQLARILKPGARLLLTVDIDLGRDSDIGLGPARYKKLREALRDYFTPIYESQPVHPGLLLTTFTSPFPFYKEGRRLGRLWRLCKEELLKPLLRRPRFSPWHLACEGMVLWKRDK